MCTIQIQVSSLPNHFYCPPTILREGNVFSRVCLSVILSTLPMMHWTSPYSPSASSNLLHTHTHTLIQTFKNFFITKHVRLGGRFESFLVLSLRHFDINVTCKWTLYCTILSVVRRSCSRPMRSQFITRRLTVCLRSCRTTPSSSTVQLNNPCAATQSNQAQRPLSRTRQR